MPAAPIRHQGKITGWKRVQGYGFVVPDGEHGCIFVHISVFASGARRPANGDLISFERMIDDRQRFFAGKIRFVQAPMQSITVAASELSGMLIATLFRCFILAGWYFG